MLEKLQHLSTQFSQSILRRFPLAAKIPAYFDRLSDSQISKGRRALYAFQGLGVLFGVFMLLVFIYALILIPFTPRIVDLQKAKQEQPSVLLSADGKELTRYRRLNREWVKLKRISPHVVDALIATEDHRFYDHHGVDLKRTTAAVLYTLTGDTQGGSTITQQLARNLFPDEIGREVTLTRKLKELITALKIEHAYSKDEILETYLNTVPFLYNAFGIEMAARTYFDKSASRLNLLESATLIGMLKGTSYYNPVLNPDRAIKRRNLVLSEMVKRGRLTKVNLRVLNEAPLRLDFERQREPLGGAPHFAEQMRKWLVDWADRNGYNIYADGLVIHSTIDSRLQRYANQAVARQLQALQAVADVEWGLRTTSVLSTSLSDYAYSRRRVQPFSYFWKANARLLDTFIRETPKYRALRDEGADDASALAQLHADSDFIRQLREQKTLLQTGLVAIDPQTGFIKAWVGSRGFNDDQYDHVLQAKRQPGSTFKPFVYAGALQRGMSPNQRFEDSAVEIKLPNGSIWRPNDETPPTGQRLTMRQGLIYSKNTITAQVMQEVGARKVARLAKDMGITDSRLDPVPSLALGTSPVTLLEMVTGYSTIANNGDYRKPLSITHITDKHGKTLVEFESESKRALDKEHIVVLRDMMRGVINEGTGAGIRRTFSIGADVAGKTGTTQNNTDGWFILMHPQLVAGAWVGFNDARVTMRSGYWGQGAHNALYVVGDFFKQALNSGAINGRDRFESPPVGLLDYFRNQLEEWFGGARKPIPDALPPRGSEQEATPQPRNDIDQILDEEMKQAEQAYDERSKEAQKIIEQQVKEFGKLQRQIEKELDRFYRPDERARNPENRPPRQQQPSAPREEI